MDHSKFSFLSGEARYHDFIVAAEAMDELIDHNRENTNFFVLDGSSWSKYTFLAEWTAISMTSVSSPNDDRTFVAVSPLGDYWEATARTVQESNGIIPQAVFPLRALTAIDGDVYACGMGRSVLRRMSRGEWKEIGPGTAEEDDGVVVGFEGMDGFSANEIYAVGWRGEIWKYDGNQWSRFDSPVSANLNAVCCASDGKVYIVGDKGCMLRGRDDIWEVLDMERLDNLMDVAYFDKTVFVTTDFHILKMVDDVLVPENAFSNADDVPATCLHLLVAEDALVSMGTKDLFRLIEGAWERVV